MTSITSLQSLFSLIPLLALLPTLYANPTPTPSPQRRATGNTAGPLLFEAAGDLGISGQIMFLGGKNKVYVLDKTENNPLQVTGIHGTHPAWAVEYDVNTQKVRPMDVAANPFCAGGGVLGNGTWVVFGGNKAVTTGATDTFAPSAYNDTTGGTAIRMLDPCDDESCEWIQNDDQPFNDNAPDITGGWLQMTSKRWYPTVEVLEDGSMIVIGGDLSGGYVNSAGQDNPTYEFFPPKGDGSAIHLQFLSDTLPINLYALTWLMPSGQLFMQANRESILYDYNSQNVTNLPAMPFAARVYPASAATAMLPLSKDNNYNPTILFCGGSNPPNWGNDGGPTMNITSVAADNSCVRINPDDPNPTYITDDYMLEGRSMGQFVLLPDGTFWMGNGVAMGTAGYSDQNWSIGEALGQNPLYTPAIYNYSAPAGTRWNRTGITASSNERMYHSTAILLADASVLICGSNPNKDFTTAQWRTRTDCERWYPWYYNETRPTYTGAPSSLSYGGNPFDITVSNLADEATVQSLKVVIIRGGFNTHAIGMGQRMLYLETSYNYDANTKNATIHVSQMPGNNGPTTFQPGPAMMFVVVNGVPSEAEFVMIGTGNVEQQPTTTNAALPSSTATPLPAGSQSAGSGSDTSGTSTKGAGYATASVSIAAVLLSAVGALLVM